MNHARRLLVRETLTVWSPDYPRRVRRFQDWAAAPGEVIAGLEKAESTDTDSPFISVYSFPRGHTNDGFVPDVDTLFIDFDFEEGDYHGNGNEAAWRRDLSHLLVRVRKVASYILESGDAQHWRASLSGHKGIHLFLDFPMLDHELGSRADFIGGMSEYANQLVDHLAINTGIKDLDDYVDVVSSDLGRLCRVPNTLHGKATESLGEERFCVPVTLNQLSHMTVDRYAELTSAPRPIGKVERVPDEEVGKVIRQHVQNATGTSTRMGGASTVDWDRVDRYREESNDSIQLSDVELLTSDRPRVWEFHEREDKFDYGYQSHFMELFCIVELTHKNVPIDVIKEFLSNSPRYDESYTESRIEQIISRDYNRFGLETIHSKAPEFCTKECPYC